MRNATHTFRSPYDEYKARNGESCVFVETRTHATHPEHMDEEVGPLHVVRFADGVELEAWPEEIHPITGDRVRDAAPALLAAARALLNCHTGAPWQTQRIRDRAFRDLSAAVQAAEGGPDAD